MILGIFVEFDNETDAEWLRNKCLPVVENEVEEAQDEERLDSKKVEVSWEFGDNWADFGGNF